MSYDRYSREYHLTPIGWSIGNFYFYGSLQGKEKKPPKDRVLTLVKEVEQKSGFAKEEISWRTEWRSKKATRVDFQRLRKKFGDPPEYTE